MAEVYGLTRGAIEKIKQVVKQVLGEHLNDPELRGRGKVNYDRNAIYGILATTMVRDGTATLTVCRVNASGGPPTTATGESYTIVDGAEIPDGTTLPVGCVATATNIGGVYKLSDYDCEMEVVTL